jgi:hypothetical protein
LHDQSLCRGISGRCESRERRKPHYLKSITHRYLLLLTIQGQEAARCDPEVIAIARRRKFSGSDKRRLLAEAGRCKEAGTFGAFLRRERIYSSMIARWRKQVDAADRTALAPKRRGPKPDASVRQIERFFHWYNHEHRHGGIALMTPAAIHDGTAPALTAQRAITLDAAFASHPIRFKGVAPKPPALPTAAWINPPKKEPEPAPIKPACSLN